MSEPEMARFEAERYWREALRLRHWDDQGKVAGLKTRSLEAHATLIERVARPRA
jgi:predicted HD phosphohydrolase